MNQISEFEDLLNTIGGHKGIKVLNKKFRKVKQTKNKVEKELSYLAEDYDVDYTDALSDIFYVFGNFELYWGIEQDGNLFPMGEFSLP